MPQEYQPEEYNPLDSLLIVLEELKAGGEEFVLIDYILEKLEEMGLR